MEADGAVRVAAIVAKYPRALLSTMVSKELGLTDDVDEETEGTPLRGAVLMGISFAVGGVIPILPFLVGTGFGALLWATMLSGVALFAIGAAKSRWTHRSWVWAGLEIVALAAVAGGGGYWFGTVLPSILGFAVP